MFGSIDPLTTCLTAKMELHLATHLIPWETLLCIYSIQASSQLKKTVSKEQRDGLVVFSHHQGTDSCSNRHVSIRHTQLPNEPLTCKWYF